MAMSVWHTDSLETPMIRATPAPFVRAVIEAVDEAIRQDPPDSGLSARQRSWLACCGPATLVTPSMCWARFARASLGPDSMAALSWMCRHRTMPWARLLVASVRGLLRHHGIPAGSLGIDDTENARSKAAQTLAYLSTLRDTARGGSPWGPSRVCLLLVTPNISMPVGVVFSQPEPALRAGYRRDKALKKPKALKAQRPPTPAPKPASPPNHHLALRLLEACQANHPAIRVHGSTADALSGPAPCVDAASALVGGVPVLSHRRSHQNSRIGKRAQPVAD